MKILGFHSKKDLDSDLVQAFIEGCGARGETAKVYSADYPDSPECDAVVIFGVKGRERFEQYRAAGVNTIYLDKGYVRRSIKHPIKRMEFWRVAVNAHHPTAYLDDMKSPRDRWDALGIKAQDWRAGREVVFAGSSEKFHEFHGLADPTSYARKVVQLIEQRTRRHIIYRPKPSWDGAVPIHGAEFSNEGKIRHLLNTAHALVTYGSNACFEAVVLGVPCIILGDAVARPISSTSIDDIEAPRRATDEERIQWLSDIAYCQWTPHEFASGDAWTHLRRFF